MGYLESFNSPITGMNVHLQSESYISNTNTSLFDGDKEDGREERRKEEYCILFLSVNLKQSNP
jgi:hypothetical protein